MLTLTGQVINVLRTAEFVNKDTGEVRPPGHQVQILTENALKNGEKRSELVNLKTDTPEEFKALQGQSVAIPVSAFARAGTIFYSLPPDARPQKVNTVQK